MMLTRSDGVERVRSRHFGTWSTSINAVRLHMRERSPATTPTLPTRPRARSWTRSGHLRRFDETREFYPWFYVLLRNRCFKQVRPQDRPGAHEPVEPAAPAVNSPEDLYDLRTALDQLPSDDRELIVLKHLDGWTYDELAERLEIPRGTVMSRLFHARQRLKALMSGPGGGPR